MQFDRSITSTAVPAPLRQEPQGNRLIILTLPHLPQHIGYRRNEGQHRSDNEWRTQGHAQEHQPPEGKHLPEYHCNTPNHGEYREDPDPEARSS
jgi:hypothetical protein